MRVENRAKLLPLCHVKYQNGMGGIEIDGVNYGAMNGYVAFLDNRSWATGPVEPPTLDVLGDKSADDSRCDVATIREMYLAGVRIYALGLNIRLYWKDNGIFEYDVLIRDLEEIIGYIRKYAPDSYFTIRWKLFVPEWWAERYPTEVLTYNDGTNRTYSGVHASYTSKIWREQAGEILEKSIKRIIDSELVHYFAGIQLGYGNCGEWNNFGYHERHFPDFSECTQNAFKEWGGKEIPKPEERLRDRDKTLRNLPEGKNAADFYQFWQETTVDTILYFAHIVRTVTEGRSLVGTFYGYYVGHLYHFTGPYHFQDSGHYAVGRLVESN